MAAIRRVGLGDPATSLGDHSRAKRTKAVLSAGSRSRQSRTTPGGSSAVCAVVRDVTEHKQLSQLEERDTQFPALLEQLIAGVFILSDEGQILSRMPGSRSCLVMRPPT